MVSHKESAMVLLDRTMLQIDGRSKIDEICGRGMTRILFCGECIFSNTC